MSSRRLPGKMLREMNGKPLLGYLLERFNQLECLDDYIVATSSHNEDDAIEQYCNEHGVKCFRGSLDCVSERLANAAEMCGFDFFFRVCGDSPLVDLDLFRCAFARSQQGQYDLITNVFPRSYPPGQSVELINANSFTRTLPLLQDSADREHVTRYFYNHSTQFEIYNISSSCDYGDMTFAVDTEDDFNALETLVSRLARPHWSYKLDELVQIASNAILSEHDAINPV